MKTKFAILSPLASKWQSRMLSLLERNVQNVSNSYVIDKLVPMKGYAENKYVNTDRMFSEITIYHNLTPQVLE